MDIGIWLFDTAYSGVSLSLDLIERLAAIENVCGIKVGRDHAHYLEVLDRVGGQIMVCEPQRGHLAGEHARARPAGVHVLGRAVPVPDAGVAADARVHRAGAGRRLRRGRPGRRHARPGARGGRQVAARQARRLADALASIKAWAGLVGMSGGPVRPPLLPHTQAELAELAADLDAVGLLPGTGASGRVSCNGHRPTLA